MQIKHSSQLSYAPGDAAAGMPEKTGFEPAERQQALNTLARCHFQPLSHLSEARAAGRP